MHIRIGLLLVISLFNAVANAAQEHLIWGSAPDVLSKYHMVVSNKSGLLRSIDSLKQGSYQLQKSDNEPDFNLSHVRYQLLFKNIPVWGHELILHKKNNATAYLSGIDVSGIEHDLKTVTPKYSAEEIETKLLAAFTDKIMYKNTEQIIYLDHENKSHLAYHLAMYTNSMIHFVAAPNYIVDANTGNVLKQWDDLTHKKIGQGLGGNVFILPYRPGIFQHGTVEKDIPSLGAFDVTVKGGKCYVETPEIRVINVAQTDMDQNSFPVLSLMEFFKKPPTFSYPCNKKSHYVNSNDGDTAPVNFSFSPVNDTMYFAGVTLDMYKNYYGVAKPIGDDLPLRAYTHLKNFDNAFAVPSIKIKGLYLIHQQIVIGDGNKRLTAPAQGSLAHELSHNFTRIHSNLIYAGQSGGINESFSDMASIAMFDYLRKDYPWYWNGLDWSVGREATIGAQPMRYMDEPVKDGISIDNARDFNDELDVHQSSGVFNKAFYLLSQKPDWSVRKAFQVMIDANRNYWTSGTHFEAASCGVIQAAIDRHYNTLGVKEAFAAVGVVCPLNTLMS
ncbi:M4 family metallopeptidase [Legionella worsleiensis]|uniref:Neutral metalloproteinase n=1 Tax=Legionella worsleiensis TaxID=45076 RepID=A0A0W1A6J1_9GAMM|nr:M4 family metallopeptidase [Legionella worsleiensis]KTD76974.1 class 4 metalloprotease [Legionella worsleiensis]STY33354.1 zinc metalloprotease [Legionella worsleiensis]